MRNLCENGIDTEVTQEKERILANDVKLVQRFQYLLAKLGNSKSTNARVWFENREDKLASENAETLKHIQV